ncbi:MAG: NUDIX hydrolase [Chloroflexi bacterium]|nr:NUDIX hydrolase [Chloroflexota bacterium]
MNDRPISYCPYCGTPTVKELLFGEERPTCPNCHWIYFADPKVAVAVVVEQEGKVLLTRRINPPYQGCWTLPAGFVDAHEDPVKAAARECLEETGLVVQVTDLLDVLAGREHRNGADILIAYRATILGGNLQAGDDADQVDFFSRDQLPPLAFKTTHKLLKPDTP